MKPLMKCASIETCEPPVTREFRFTCLPSVRFMFRKFSLSPFAADSSVLSTKIKIKLNTLDCFAAAAAAHMHRFNILMHAAI